LCTFALSKPNIYQKMRKILFAFSLIALLSACGGGTANDQALNTKLAQEHQEFEKEHEMWTKEHELREQQYKKWGEEYDALKLKTDTTAVYDPHQELQKQHTIFLKDHKKNLLEYDEKFMNVHTELIKSHKDGKIDDKTFQAKHDTLAARHKQLLTLHQQMNDHHKKFEEQQKIEMDRAKDPKKEEKVETDKK
jgi:hypothetical protein